MYYIHTDHLGSIRVITGENGNMEEEMSFDAWGRRRNPADWTYTNVPEPVLTDRGYTLHEHLDEFDLINMNGRLYDPRLGRFLNADPLIGDLFRADSYNSYSYVLNNPLSYTDPSGYSVNRPMHYSMQELEEFYEWQRSAGGNFGRLLGNDHTWGGFNESYSYNWLTGSYETIRGESVNWGEVYSSFMSANFYPDGTPRNSTSHSIKYRFSHTEVDGNIGNPLMYKKKDGIWYTYLNGEWVPSEEGSSDMLYDASSSGGTTVAGTAGAIASELYYSEKYGTWMGKNFKLYKQTWGGNGFTGGKNKFGKTTSNAIKWGGRVLGAWNAYSINEGYRNGEMGTGMMVAEQGSNLYSVFGGIYGAAWGVGWELGRAITTINAYQEFKFNFWYNQMEKRIGAPNQFNENLWYEFFQNF